jgi:hypothetical protein
VRSLRSLMLWLRAVEVHGTERLLEVQYDGSIADFRDYISEHRPRYCLVT